MRLLGPNKFSEINTPKAPIYALNYNTSKEWRILLSDENEIIFFGGYRRIFRTRQQKFCNAGQKVLYFFEVERFCSASLLSLVVLTF